MTALLFAVATASASGVLVADTAIVPLESMAASGEVTRRVATVTTSYAFAEAEGDTTFSALLPDDAAVAGLRFRVEDGGWVSAAAGGTAAGTPSAAAALSEGAFDVFTAVLPPLTGRVEVELTWQRLLTATDGALALDVPLDDQGLNPGPVPVVVRLTVLAAGPVLEAEVEPAGEVVVEGAGASTVFDGTLDDAAAVSLTWAEEPAPFGIEILAYRPETDPFTHERGGPGYALGLLQPGPADPDARVEELLSLVVDSSASMRGASLDAAVLAGATWLRALPEEDRFNAIVYSSQARAFRAVAPYATSDDVEDGVRFLQGQQALGLSDPAEALTTTLELASDTVQRLGFFSCGGTARGEAGDAPPIRGAPVITETGRETRLAPYVVWLTDGGATTGLTEPDAIASAVEAANAIGASLFAIGIGAGVDRDLLDRLAGEHRGEARYVADTAGILPAVTTLRKRLSEPLLAQPVVVVDGAFDQSPADLPDVAAGHEVAFAFRWDEAGDLALHLTGIRGRDDIDTTFTAWLPDVDDRAPAVATAWAQLRIEDLERAYRAGDPGAYGAIVDLVTTYGVASAYVTLDYGYATGEAALDASAEPGDAAGCACATAPPPLAWLPFAAAIAAGAIRRRGRGAEPRRTDARGTDGAYPGGEYPSRWATGPARAPTATASSSGSGATGVVTPRTRCRSAERSSPVIRQCAASWWNGNPSRTRSS